MNKADTSKSKATPARRGGFPDDFKRDAVRLIVEEEYSFKAAAKAVGVSENSLRAWHRKFAPAPKACGAMSTHLHAVLWPEEGVNLSDVLRDFKRYTSRAISREASRMGHHNFMRVFAGARRSGRAQSTSQLQVWQEGSHPEAIYSDDFARQKMEYIHTNPVRANLIGRPEEWPYSSARMYLLGEQTYPPTDLLPLS